jgi:hypothetical protein
MNKIEQMEAQLEQLKRELEEYKKGAQEVCVRPQISVPPALLPVEGKYYISEVFSSEPIGCTTKASKEDQNVFPDEETADAYGEAFSVMLELRRQPGSCAFDGGETMYAIDADGDASAREWRGSYTVSPPFSSEEWAEKAIDAVGKERIVQAYKTLRGN